MTAVPARPATRVGATEKPTARPSLLAGTRSAVRSAWDAPVTSYYLIGSVTLVLVALGLVFVLSSSTVSSLADTADAAGGRTPFGELLGQLQFAAMGLIGCFIVSRMPVRALQLLAWPVFLGSLGLQLLPLAFGYGSGGNYAWVQLGPISFQPGEFAKVGLALWLGAMLAAKRHQLGQFRHAILPIAGAGLMVGLQVVITKDLGTALVLGALVAGALFVAGLPLRVFTILGVAGLSVVAFFATMGESRTARIMALFNPEALDSNGLGLQTKYSLAALGTGGFSGVGLGGSRTKWLYLPEADNDFILAIIGEELGLLGTLLVLVLVALLLVGLTRVVLRHPNPFAAITAAAVGAWIGAQALVNIGVVVGLLPVIGLPLPLISSGGSSLIATLIALGMVLAFAREEPGAKEALAARRGVVRRSFGVMTGGLRHAARRGRKR